MQEARHGRAARRHAARPPHGPWHRCARQL